jgi:hypothetical protein
MNDEGSDRSIKNERQHQVASGVGATRMSLIHWNSGIQFFGCDIADLVFEAVLQVVRLPLDCEGGIIRRLPPTSCGSVVSALGRVQHVSAYAEYSQEVRTCDWHSWSRRFVIKKWKREK